MLIKKRLMTSLLAAVACGACGVEEAGSASPQGAASTVAALAPSPEAQSAKVVEAANAFLATLDDSMRKAALFSFTDATQRTRWTNFPVGMVPRAGVRWGELDTTQRAALMNLLGAVLSSGGVKMVTEQMAADDVLKNDPAAGAPPGGPGGAQRTGGPPPGGAPSSVALQGGPARGGRGGGGGGGSPNFGSDYYYVAFLGAPSATAPWMLQFGGHHLGVNATMVGPKVTLSPTLTGGQPVKFVKDGQPIYIVADEVKQSVAMLNSLTLDQRRKVVISDQGIDLVLGPGHDGQTLQPEGLPGSEMTNLQKAQLLELIEARLNILNASHVAATLAQVRADLNKTYLAWYGPTTQEGAAYFRVTGPTIIMEFSPQGLGGDATNHLHNMYRDPTNEYGAAWTSLK